MSAELDHLNAIATALPKPMRRVLVRYTLRGYGTQWYIGYYCIDEGEPGVWYLDGIRNGVGARAISEWKELPQ